MKYIYIIVSGLFVAFVHVAWAQSAPPESTDTAEVSPPKQIDKSRYNPFNPTPSGEMREFLPDRPYVTDSPYTVDAGHCLVEMGLFEYTRDRWGMRLDEFAFGDTNIRLGVTNYADIELMFTAYSYLLTRNNTGGQLKQSGFSDTMLRSKINILGDDAGPVAIAFFPGVTFPSGAAGVTGGGFAGFGGLLAEFALPAGFKLRTESAIQTIHEPSGGSVLNYWNSAGLGHAITKTLATYIELWTQIPTANGSWMGTFDTGLIYQPAKNWQLDAGVNIGVTKAAPGLFPFVGAAWQF
jgi:Putative MetA-pathway of phenol degradation